MSVGHSRRTPAKHKLMSSIIGREVGAASKNPAIDRHVWKDLCAGDGIPVDGRGWCEGCSPGIFAYHATHAKKPVDLELYEIKPATYDRLIESLKLRLPELGYENKGDCWQFRDMVTLRTFNASGSDAGVDDIGRRDAVLISNDPNAITDWAMRPTFAAEIEARTPWFRSISTMGCNAAGLKRLSLEERMGWFRLIEQQESALPRHRDLLLAAIDGDASQWAYLLNDPVKWRGTQEKVAVSAFARYAYRLETAWYGTQRAAYEQMKRRLFLTKTELEW